MNPAPQHPGDASSAKPADTRSEAQLIARLEQTRSDLMDASGVLQKPLRAVAQAEDTVRRIAQILPYAITAIAVAGLAASLLSRRKVRPALLIATGLDVWRLWKSYKRTASMPSPSAMDTASPMARRPLTPPAANR